VNIKDLPKDAVLTSILLFIGASSAYIEVPLLALPLILLLPGYSLSTALFPCKDDLNSIERLAISIGLNVSLVSLLAVGINVLGLNLWVFAHASLGHFSDRCIYADICGEKTQLRQNAYNLKLPQFDLSLTQLILIMLLILATVIVLGLEQDKPVELYLMDRNGTLNLAASETSNVIVVVANHAGRGSYMLSINGNEHTLKRYQFTLEGESIWKMPLSFEEVNNLSRLNFILYRDGKQIRRLHLLLNT